VKIKLALGLLSLGVLASFPIYAQQPKRAAVASKTALSDAYAKAALRALKAIQRDASTTTTVNGQELGNKDTLKSIDDADIEARSDGERLAMEMLVSLYKLKMIDNLNRSMMVDIYKDEDVQQTSYTDYQIAYVDQRMKSDEAVRALEMSQSDCFTSVEEMIKSHSFNAYACIYYLHHGSTLSGKVRKIIDAKSAALGFPSVTVQSSGAALPCSQKQHELSGCGSSSSVAPEKH
jgi:hypothetical protein